MSSLRKFQREDIINVAYNLVKSDGIEALNARRIASKLNSSVQPIFHNFENMDELRGEVINRIYDTYVSYMKKGVMEEKAYKGMGIAYIKFAKENPNFFKVLFMSESNLSPDSYIINDNASNNIIENGRTFSGLDYEQQKKFHLKVWIFTHGIATMVATNTVDISDKEIEELVVNTVREMLIGFKNNKQGGILE